MAERKDDVIKELEDLEQEITCGVCLEHYEDPRLFPCGHYFCKQCIIKLSLQVRLGKPIKCPECQVEVIVSKENVEGLKIAFNINRLKDTYASLCQAYEKKKAVAPKEIENAPNRCKKHDDFLQLFCYHCEQFICRDCGLTSHRSHTIEYISKAVPKKKKEFQKATKFFRETEEEFEKAILKFKAKSEELKSHQKSVADFIQAYYDELHAALEEHKVLLLKQNSDIADLKHTVLKDQGKKTLRCLC